MAYEFRKIHRGGIRHSPDGRVRYRMVFWIPIKARFRSRDDNRTSIVPNLFDHELKAIRSGELEEIIVVCVFPELQSDQELKDKCMPIWDRLTLERLREVPKPLWESNTRHYRLAVPQLVEDLNNVAIHR